jgi:hypothetical protein
MRTILNVFLVLAMIEMAATMKLRSQDEFKKIEVKELLEKHQDFDIKLFTSLLTREDSAHIFLSDANNLMKSIQMDFPDVVQLKSIGKTW